VDILLQALSADIAESEVYSKQIRLSLPFQFVSTVFVSRMMVDKAIKVDRLQSAINYTTYLIVLIYSIFSLISHVLILKDYVNILFNYRYTLKEKLYRF